MLILRPTQPSKIGYGQTPNQLSWCSLQYPIDLGLRTCPVGPKVCLVVDLPRMKDPVLGPAFTPQDPPTLGLSWLE